MNGMLKVIDFHVRVFPSPVGANPSDNAIKVLSLRRQIRTWLKPAVGALHEIRSHLRYFPPATLPAIDQLSAVVPIAGLAVEATYDDLRESMQAAHVDLAVVTAQSPFIPSEFILELCQQDESLIPAVNVPKGTVAPQKLLKTYIDKGARVLKVHPEVEGEGADLSRYNALIRTAGNSGLPVVIHTDGLPYSSAERFTHWFKKHPDTQFILAHMNFHQPEVAMELCDKFKNIWLDTSRQPAEIIGEAVRRVGSERILFGSDWPMIGNNMALGRGRIQDCVEIGLLNEEQAQHILGVNAFKLLGLSGDANGTC